MLERRHTSGNFTAHTWETPVGVLREESCYLPESACSGITRYPIQNVSDLDVFLYILEHRHLEPDNISDYRHRFNLWAVYDGVPSLGLPRSPLSAIAYEWTGIQNLAFLIQDHRERIQQV